MLYDRNDQLSRLQFCREYRIHPETESRARERGWPWPPWVQVGKRIVYSRERCREWFEQQDSGSRRDEAATTGGS